MSPHVASEADPEPEEEVGEDDSNHQSRLAEKKSEKTGFLSSLGIILIFGILRTFFYVCKKSGNRMDH